MTPTNYTWLPGYIDMKLKITDVTDVVSSWASAGKTLSSCQKPVRLHFTSCLRSSPTIAVTLLKSLYQTTKTAFLITWIFHTLFALTSRCLASWLVGDPPRTSSTIQYPLSQPKDNIHSLQNGKRKVRHIIT